MRSKANIKGHPIHPMLIPFPIAFLVGAVAFDVAGVATERVSWWVTGGYLAVAGIATAVLAALPGLVDFIWTVPPASSAKKRATLHMAVNLTVVGLFVLALWLRDGPTVRPTAVTLAIGVVALVLLGVGGWLGGTLAYRNQIGVDVRYAEAGKWREASVEARDGAPIQVAKADELQPDQMKLLHVDGRRVVLARTSDGYVAFDDHCTHRGGSLAGGALVCGVVQCPWHGSQFDVATGEVRAGPAKQGIRTYVVEEREGAVWLGAARPAGEAGERRDAAERREEREQLEPRDTREPRAPRRGRRQRA